MRRKQLSTGDKWDILDLQGGRCVYCDRDLSGLPIHFDHFVPYCAVAETKPSNMFAACSECNLHKSDKFFDTMEAARAYLKKRVRPVDMAIGRYLPRIILPAPTVSIRKEKTPKRAKKLKPVKVSKRKPPEYNGLHCIRCGKPLEKRTKHCSKFCQRMNTIEMHQRSGIRWQRKMGIIA